MPSSSNPTERKSQCTSTPSIPSRFLRCADLNGQPLRVTIEGLKKEDIGGEPKVVLSFTNGGKALILNKTNAKAIAKALGPETSAWRGKAIVLVPAQVDFKGDIVDAIRDPPCITAGGSRRPTPPTTARCKPNAARPVAGGFPTFPAFPTERISMPPIQRASP